MLSYNTLSKKPLLFKSFTGLSVQEFDDIYNKQIAKKYTKHEIKRLSKGKERFQKKRLSRYLWISNSRKQSLLYYLWMNHFSFMIICEYKFGTVKSHNGEERSHI